LDNGLVVDQVAKVERAGLDCVGFRALIGG
jgi:hypothetical protein